MAESVETNVVREQKPDNYEVLVSALDKVRNLRLDMDTILNTFIPKLQAASPAGSHIYARTKTADSIINKLVEKRLLNLKDPKKGLTDLVGTTIAVDGYDKLMQVRKQIEKGVLGDVFEVEDMYKDPKDGYRAVHYIIMADEGGHKIPVEVQLKTVRMKAINQLSHLPYKQHKLNEKRMLELTEIANNADHGNGTAIAEFDKIMADQPAVQTSLFKMESGGHFFINGEKTNNKPNKTGIIGKTQSGRDIYGSYDHPAHKDFTSQDHSDASEKHGYLALRHEQMGNSDATTYHASEAQKHGKVGRVMETGGAMKVIEQTDRAETEIPHGNGLYKFNFTDAVTSSDPEKFKPEWALIGQLLKHGATSQATEFKPTLQIRYKNHDFLINDNGGEFNVSTGRIEHSTVVDDERIGQIPTDVSSGSVTSQKVADLIITKLDKHLGEEPEEDGVEFTDALQTSQMPLPDKNFEFDFDKPTIVEKTLKQILDTNGASHIMKAGFSNGLYFSYRGHRFLIFEQDGEFKIDQVRPAMYLGGIKFGKRTLLSLIFLIIGMCDDFIMGKIKGIPTKQMEEGDTASGEEEVHKLKTGSVSNKLRGKMWRAIHEVKTADKMEAGGGIEGDGWHVTLSDEHDNVIDSAQLDEQNDEEAWKEFASRGYEKKPGYTLYWEEGMDYEKGGGVSTEGYINMNFHEVPNGVGFIMNNKPYNKIGETTYTDGTDREIEDVKTIVKVSPRVASLASKAAKYEMGASVATYETGGVDSVSKQPAEIPKPDLSPLLTLKYDNPYQLNKAIEMLLDSKNSTNPDDYTVDEKRFIGLYSGMGGLAKHGAKGAGLLWEYFTPDPIVQKMWGLAYKHGFNGGEVIEPASGIGAFIKYANSDCRVTGYEINKYSFAICKILFPHVKMLNEPFENRFLKNNNTVKGNVEFDEMRPKADMIIGNPPYGDFSSRGAGMGERDYTHASKYIEYFITRGLDLLREGGLLNYIIGVEVANGGIPWLQQGMTKAKEDIIAKSELLEAYRLPNGVFDRTDVVTDIIVLRKK